MQNLLLISKSTIFRMWIMSLVLFLFFSPMAHAQTIVKGKVTSAGDNLGIPGVTVSVKGTTNGPVTSTNGDGSYSISVPNNGTLVFTYIGYETKTMAVGGKSTINVQLAAANNTLNEVNVVAIGYGTQKRKDVTGSISSISADQIEKTPVTTLDQAIQGRAAGVQVTNNDASPGGSVSIQIRGVGTFNNNDPLYVVDGYPINGGLGSINQNDIASIDILKDASATAIYGNRASNGVVIVTTKRGRKGGVQVNLDALGAIQTEPRKYDVLNAQQFATLANAYATSESFNTLPEWSNPAALRNINWQDEVYKTGYKQNYNLGIRGGDEKTQAAFSAGYLDQKGITLGSGYTRYNLGLNLDYQAISWLKSSTSLKFTRTNNQVSFGTGGQGGGLGISNLNKLVPTITGNPLTDQVKDANGNYGFFTPSSQYVGYFNNPVYAIETQDQKNTVNYFLSNTSLEATLLKGLRLKTNLGINTTDYSGYYFSPSDKRRVGLGGGAVQSFYSQTSNSSFDYVWENTVAYTKDFGKSNVDFVGGVSWQKNVFSQIGGQGNGSQSDQLRTLESITTLTNVYGNTTPTALTSQFARLNYKYDDKYILTATVRHDGSSKFAEGHQYGTFPSVSAAWKLKNESFLKDNKVIYDLKLRAGYGEVGNQNSISPFQYLPQYTTGGAASSANNLGYPFAKVYQPGLTLAALPNPDLQWETSKQTNIGLDAAFLEGRLNVTVDYYDKTSSKFLLAIPVPSQTGFTTAARNVGSISNKGLELNISFNESKKDFKYNVSLNLATVNNKIVSLADGLTSISNFGSLNLPTIGSNPWNTFTRSTIGGSVGEFYGFKTSGIFQNQAEIDAANASATAKNGGVLTYYQTSGTKPGDRKYQDVNGDGHVGDNDRVSLGSPIPKFYGGFNFDASFKNFDFNMFWYASVGNKIFNYSERTLETFGDTQGGIGIQNIGTEYYQNAWTPTNPSNRYARIAKADPNGNTRPSDLFVEDGSFLKLKNVQIGYTLPSLLTKNLNISKVRFFVSGQNLITITKYSGLDPEIGQPNDSSAGRSVTASGIDIGTYPSSRYYTLGLNVTF
ncbi:TonB-dependent receptor [Pedobacter changchengzhani]|uniref:TonB-dependent receptor n=1 Tax=Pedobacter changchengzhani TaxID=2529274 RepID=A0A4R5MJJ2_9SPHI|nr:TonB-dependent receptor [Pedobacter changchengzhani]TDG35355.1 TonB-dependent receptor [Pedobacter changchengzhani]